MKFTKWTAARLMALAITVAIVWCYNWDRLSADLWSVPADYYEDSPVVLGWIRAAAEGEFMPLMSKEVSRLGAPYAANWNDWPVPCEEVIVMLGLLARVFGLFAAANLGVIFGFATSALGFYAVCRFLKFDRTWSFLCATLFAFTYYQSYRGFHHLLFTYSYVVPFILLTGALIAFSGSLRWGRGHAWLCLVTAAVAGLTNPYHLNMLGQFVCLGLGVQLLTLRRKANLQIGFASLAVAVAGFIVSNLDLFAYRWAHGANTGAVQRGYYETELFALKPLEFIVPPVSHNVGALASVGSKYARDAWIKGELFSPYLGMVAAAGLVWMFIEAARQLLAPRRTKPRLRLPAYTPAVLWLLLYSVVGGLNCVIGLAGIPLFRGSNRFSIYVSALVLMFLASRASRLTRRWQPGTKLTVAFAVLVVGLYDQLPQRTPHQETLVIAHTVTTDRAFVEAVEGKLPPKAMLFQLPVMPYPESTPVHNLQAYEHLRPYLYSKTLHFSFGSVKGRPRESWQADVEKLPASQMIAALEKYGFAAIWINRKGFADQAEGLLKQLAAAGRTQVLEDANREQVCVLLNPAATPERPSPGNRIDPQFSRGWVNHSQSPSGDLHWAGGNATVEFTQTSESQSFAVNFSCQVASPTPRRLALHLNGNEIWNGELQPGQLSPLKLVLDTRSGRNQLEWRTVPVERPSRQNPVPRTFVIVNPQFSR